MKPKAKENVIRSAVRSYIRSGYAPIPVPKKEKAPRLRGWQKLEIDEGQVDKYFSEPGNVGLLLGEPSGGLIDVDLDATEAVSAALKFLPPTGMVHGRRGKPSSHYWYVLRTAVPPVKFLDVDGTSLLELRSTGQQTIVPPSLHPSGERLRWEKEGKPAEVDLDRLRRAVARVTASALLARNWPEPGARNAAALALAGMLLRAEWSTAETAEFLTITARAASDEEWRERASAANSTQERLAVNGEATGATRLREWVGDAVVTRMQKWLKISEDILTPSDGENLTDLGNSRRLVKQHGDRIRFCHISKCWYRFDGKRWKPDVNGAVERLAKKTVRGLSEQAAQSGNGPVRKRFSAWAKASESRSRITALIDLAKSEPGIPIDPAQMDADPWLLNCENGTIDLRTGELISPRRDDLCTKITPIAYEPDARCSNFKKFLRQILNNNPELVNFVQRAVGYALTGSTAEQVLFILWGSGANGKSTLLEILRAILGEYGRSADAALLMHRNNDGVRNDVARLAGARFVSTSETEAGRHLAEVLVKQLTGGDKVTARFLYSEFFEFDAQFKLFLTTNHKPGIRGTDNAIWRRIRLIPFEVTIPEEQQDKDLPQKLRTELPGILAWAVRGCLRWQKDGLGQSEKISIATADYRAEMDILGAFLKNSCVERADLQETAGNIYAAYKRWCDASGEKALTQQRLGVALADRGFKTNRTSRTRFWLGLKCREMET